MNTKNEEVNSKKHRKYEESEKFESINQHKGA